MGRKPHGALVGGAGLDSVGPEGPDRPHAAPAPAGSPVAVRYRAQLPIRPVLRYIIEAAILLLASAFLVAGDRSMWTTWVMAAAFAGCVVSMERTSRRYARTIDLYGDRVVVGRERSQSMVFDVTDLRSLRDSKWRGTEALLTDERRVPIWPSGRLAPLVRLIGQQSPRFVTPLLPKLEKAERAEEKNACRLDRHPWMRPAGFVLGFALLVPMLLTLVLTTIEQRKATDRAVGVYAEVIAVDAERGNDGDATVTVEFQVGDGRQQASYRVASPPAVGSTTVAAVDTRHPEIAWEPGRRPPIIHPWQLSGVAVSLVLAIAWALLLPTAFAEHPVLEPLDPDKID